MLLIDLSHENIITVADLNLLIPRIIARGFHVEYLSEGADLKEKLLPILQVVEKKEDILLQH